MLVGRGRLRRQGPKLSLKSAHKGTRRRSSGNSLATVYKPVQWLWQGPRYETPQTEVAWARAGSELQRRFKEQIPGPWGQLSTWVQPRTSSAFPFQPWMLQALPGLLLWAQPTSAAAASRAPAARSRHRTALGKGSQSNYTPVDRLGRVAARGASNAEESLKDAEEKEEGGEEKTRGGRGLLKDAAGWKQQAGRAAVSTAGREAATRTWQGDRGRGRQAAAEAAAPTCLVLQLEFGQTLLPFPLPPPFLQFPVGFLQDVVLREEAYGPRQMVMAAARPACSFSLHTHCFT